MNWWVCDYCGEVVEKHVEVRTFLGIRGTYCYDCYNVMLNRETRPQEYAKIVADAALNGRYDR
jgi:hypothetical protein